MDIDEYAEALIDTLAGDAVALGCHDELRCVQDIIREGTSADRQLDLFRLRRVEGATEQDALRSVVDLVTEETREGVCVGADCPKP